MTMKDEWLRAAMTDDKLVVDLLLRLKQSPESSARSMKPPQPPLPSNLTLPPLDWGIRQPRSKLSASSSSSSAKKETTRRSPTTPLSWSAGCGAGGGVASPSDGYEESTTTSRPSSSSAATAAVVDRFGSSGCRSKGAAANENTNSSGKRPRRKKTFVELKDEENSLIKERAHLKKQIASLQSALKEQRSLNVNLKRFKLDLRVEESGIKAEPKGKVSVNSSTAQACTATLEDDSSSVPKHLKDGGAVVAESSSSSVQQKDPMLLKEDDPGFVLPDLNAMPDLNMIPAEEEDAVVGAGAC